MRPTSLEIQRRRFGAGLAVVASLTLIWFFSPGLPVIFGPWASAATREAGRAIFEHEWVVNDPLAHGDGLGPVFNATSCVACHSQGGVGGGGPQSTNIRNFEVVPNRRDAQGHAGTIHHFATQAAFRESFDQVRRKYPVIKGSTTTVRDEVNHCTYTRTIPDFDPVRSTTVQPTALFGAGWIDRISSKAFSASLMHQAAGNIAKEFQLDFSGIPPGKVRELPDGRIGRFGWKAQFATLEEFVAAACANELGLGTPRREQVRPFTSPGYTAAPDLNKEQFSALVAFVDTLPRPVEIVPDSATEADRAAHGKALFSRVGCGICHVPDMGGVKGVYSDFLLHTIDDQGGGGGSGYGPEVQPEVPPSVDQPKDVEWRTPPLWGVADSAPYLHDGTAPTLRDAILRHGADAKISRDAFKKLTNADQEAVVAFLQTLRAPPDALPVSSKSAQARGR